MAEQEYTDDSKHRVQLFDHSIQPEELKPGDHIYMYKEAYAYQHHGIYVGKNSSGVHLVIHKRDKKKGKKDGESNIGKTSLEEFLDGAPLKLVAYNADSTLLKRAGGAHKIKCLPPDEVIKRAEYYLKNPGEWNEYDLLTNNCEHFAIYCKTGKKRSEYGDDIAVQGGRTSKVVDLFR